MKILKVLSKYQTYKKSLNFNHCRIWKILEYIRSGIVKDDMRLWCEAPVEGSSA